MSAKQIEIQKWLINLFGESDVPSFENTEHNVELLYHLMESHIQARKDISVVNKYMESRAQNYQNLTQHIIKVLHAMNFSPSCLNGTEKKCFDSHVNICHELNIESPQLTNIVLGINHLESQSISINGSLEQERKMTGQLLNLSQETSQKLEDIKRISDNADQWQRSQQESIELEERKVKFSQTKSQEYSSEIKIMEEKLLRGGFSEEISHEALLRQMERLEAVEKEFKEAKTTLESYVLPHDMDLAKLKVEEAKNYLESLMK